MRKIYLVILSFCCLCNLVSAQVVVNTGFENGGSFPPTGWTVTGSTTYLAAVSGTGGSPTTTGPHGGTYYCRFNSYSAGSGTQTQLITPVINWGARAGAATVVTIWWWRDVASYNTTTYDLEGVTAYVNTSATMTGATSMGFVPRRGGLGISGGVTGTSTTTTSGWFQYTFTVPTTFNTSNNYIIFNFYSRFGDNCFMDDVQYTEFPPPCSGTPTAGTVTATATSGCGFYLSGLSLSGATAASGITYQWQSSPNNVTWTSVTGATNGTFTAGVAASTYYRCQVTCTNSSITSTTAGLLLSVSSPPTYATVPYNESFESGWTNLCGTREVPNSYWVGTPATGNNSWRRNDDGAAAVWTSPASGIYSPAASVGSYSARFHTYYASSGTTGNLYFFVNLPAGTKNITYQYINTSGSDGLTLSLSTDGGATFSTIDAPPAVATTWTTRSLSTVAVSSTAILRFSVTSDFGVTDVGLDNFNVFCGLPAITGPTSTCVGSTVTLSDPTAGGTWSSTNTAVGTIDAGTGQLTGLSVGTTTISYVQAGCSASTIVTVNAVPSVTVSATPAAICPTFSSTLTATSTNPGASGYLVNTITYAPESFTPTGTFNLSTTPTAGTNDDGYYAVTLPFNFTLFGTTYTAGSSCYIVTNGYVTFGAGYTGLTMGNMPNASYPAMIGLFSRDMDMRTTGSITYGTSGTTPDRKFIISYNSVPVYGSPASPEIGQIVIYESSGIIDLQVTTTQASTHTMGIQTSGGSQFTAISGHNNSTTAISNSAWRLSVPAPSFTWSPATFLSSTTASSTVAGPLGSTMTYTVTATATNGCSTPAPVTVTVNPSPQPITGNLGVCLGLTSTLSDVGGGTWTSSNAAIASVGSSTGIVNGNALGTATITYTLPTGCIITAVVTVNPQPSAITGVFTACPGTSATLNDVDGGGTWTSNNTAIATAGTSSGIISGVAGGTTTITYTLPTGCIATTPFTVNPLPAAITGTTIVCPLSTVALSDASTGGLWTSSNTALATVASTTGVVTGVSGGVLTITYTLPTGCLITTPVTVHTTAPITGSFGICSGFSVTLSNSIGGGVWSSSNSAVASVGTSSGIVTGISGGSAFISYTFPNGCTTTQLVGVTNTPSTYTVTGGGYFCAGGAGVHVGVTGSNSGVSYQMYVGGLPVGSAVLGTGGPVDFGLVTTPGTYTVIANPGSPCATTMSSTATITVLPAPNSFSVTGGGAYCAGTSGVHIGLSGSNTGISYQLYNSTSSVGLPLTGTTTILDFGLLTAVGTYTVTATNITTGCTGGMTGSATVSVNPLPTAYAMTVTGGGSYCTGGPGVTVGLGNSDAGVNYQLFRGGVAIGTPVAGVAGPLSFGLQTIAGSYTAIATNATTGCVNNMTGASNVSINSLPTVFMVAGGGSFCTGGTGVTITLSGSQTGVTYSLYNGATLMGALPGTGLPLTSPLINIPGTYTVVATNGTTGCTSNMLGSATITTNPLPGIFDVTGGGNYCAGGEGRHVGLSGSVIGTNYYLYRGTTLVSGASGTTAPLDFGLFTTPGVYTITAVLPGTGCSAIMNGSVTITIDPLPSLYVVSGGGSYCAGGAGFHVLLSNSSPSADYKLLNSGLTTGISMTGTGSGLDFGVFTAPGTYTVFAVDNTTGCTSYMTGSASITINPLPLPYTVTGGGKYCAGGTGLHVGLSNSGAGINYQLYKDGLATGAPVAGTGTAIDFGVKTAAGNYTVVATNVATGCINNMSGSVDITINPLPVVYTVSGGGAYCAGGTGVHVLLNNSGTDVDYQLMRGTTAVGATLAGTTGVGLDFGLQTTAGTYTVVATDANTGCVSNMTGSATISINPLPAAMMVTGGGNYCTGGTGVHVGISGSVAGTTYQLYLGTATVGIPLPGSGFALDFGLQTASGAYTVKATNTITGCTAWMTGSVSVNINPLPVVYAVSGGGNYCAGGAGAHVGLASSSSGVNYQLRIGGIAYGSAMAGSGSSLDFGAQTMAGSYTVVATDAVTGCVNIMSGSVSVGVDPLPAGYTITGGGNYCPGGAGADIGLAGSQAGVTYQLYNGGTLAGTISGTGVAVTFGPQTATGTYTVAATNNTTGCMNNMPGSVTVGISLLPNPYMTTGGGNYCPGSSGTHIGLSGSDTWMSYQLYNGATAYGAPMTGTGSALDFGSITTPGTYTIVATGTGTSGCTGNMIGSTDVGISALPGLHTVTGGGGYCAGSTPVTVGLDGSDLNTMYQLMLGTSAVGSPLAGTGAALDFGPQASAGFYTVVATDNSTTCSVNMSAGAVVVVNPLPVVYTATGGGSYCIGGTGVNISISGSSTGVNYDLYNGMTLVSGPAAGTGSTLSFGPQTATGSYTVMATDVTTGCTNTMGGSVSISTTPLPVAFEVGGGGGYCTGGTGVHITLDGSAPGMNYQLWNGMTMSGAPVSGSGLSLDFGLRTAAGTYTVIATNTTTGCTNSMIRSATVVAEPLPNAYVVSGSSSGYCIGGTGVTITMGASDAGVNYQLYRGTIPVGTPLPGSGGMVNFGVQTIPGSYSVVGTNATTGCTNNMLGGANIVINMPPNTFAVTGGGSFCTGGTGVSVSLAGSNSGVSYQLYRTGIATGPALSGTGSSLNFGLQTVPGTYTVVATNVATGCTATMTGSAPVAVNPLPAVFMVTGGGAFCAGGAGTLVGQSGSVIGVSYQLMNGTAYSGAPVNGTGGTLNFGMQTIGGTYTVMAYNPATGCVNTMGGSATVVVNPAPTAFLVTGGGDFCFGGTGVHVGIGGSNSGTTYQLYNGTTMSGSAITGTGSSIDFGLKTASGNYTVVASNTSTGCTGSMTGSASVVVNPLPAIQAITGGGSYCAGGTGVHVGLGSSVAGTDYTLYLGSSVITVPGTGAALDFGLQTGGGSYTAIATNHITGCSSNMTGSASVVVNPLSTPSVNISTGVGDTVCEGSLAVLTAITTNGGTAPVYSWSVNSVAVGGSSGSYTYIPVEGDVVSVSMTSSAACPSPATVSNTKTLHVNTPQIPSVSIVTSTGTTVCQGTKPVYSIVVSFGGDSCYWLVNDTVVGTSPTYSYFPLNGDVVKCIMLSDYRCRLADTAVSSVVMTVQAPVTPAVTIAANPGLNIGAGQVETLTATVTNGIPAPTYQWQINGLDVPGATFPVYLNNTYANLDVVKCNVWSGGVCSGVLGSGSVTIHVYGVGVQQVVTGAADIRIIPNPNKGTFVIKGTFGTSVEDVTIEITNMLGQSVFSGNAKTNNGEINQQVTLSNSLSNGMYMLTIRSGNESKVFHMVVEQ